jgi:hypothetical protein
MTSTASLIPAGIARRLGKTSGIRHSRRQSERAADQVVDPWIAAKFRAGRLLGGRSEELMQMTADESAYAGYLLDLESISASTAGAR